MNHIVLIHPAIPQNTGNIMRTCVATNTHLHIIKPMGFSLDDKHMKRAGLDYIKDLKLTIYEDWEDFESKNPGHYQFYTRYSNQTYSEANYTEEGDQYLLFGHEHDGIPHDILRAHLEECVRIPMYADSRSLNLSNTVAIGIYECLRQQDFPDLVRHEVQKGEHFLTEESDTKRY